uniref:Ig-like domain-containing protein n=1 Tax=Oryzias latipes TaxID=8090 RepID=A0A3P9IM74_ORYLA
LQTPAPHSRQSVLLLPSGVAMAIQIHQSPPALLKEEGEAVQLVCSHQQSDFRVMLWYQQAPGRAALKLVGYGYVQFGADAVEEVFRGDFSLAGELGGDKDKNASLLIKNLRAPEHTATYFCAASKPHEAFFGKGTKLSVLEAGINITAPTRVKVLSPSEKECSSGKKTLVCVASGFYPDHVSVSWMINGGAVSKGVATDSAATRKGTSYRITSRLTVFSEEWTSNNKFHCLVGLDDPLSSGSRRPDCQC